jgi:hypothetical protein
MRSGKVDRDTVGLVRTFNRQVIRKLHQLNRILSETGLNVTQGNILCEPEGPRAAASGQSSTRQERSSQMRIRSNASGKDNGF